MQTYQDLIARVDAAYGSLNGAALEQALTRVCEDARRDHGADSPVYAAMLSELGGFYRGAGNQVRSAEIFAQALALLERTQGCENLNYVVALNNLSGAYRYLGRYDEARAGFARSLALCRSLVGEEHILYAAGLNNLSLVCFAQNDLEGAASNQQQAAEILTKYPHAKEELATSLTNLAELYRRMHRTDEAETALQKALALYETELGTRTPHYHAVLNALGLIALERKDGQAAAGWFQKAADACLTLLDDNTHPEYLAALEHRKAAEALV